jgi:hypothetical protein
LVGEPERKGVLGRFRCIWEENIKIYLKETGRDDSVCIHLVQRGTNDEFL